jgi:hypothetical protein
MHVYIYIYICVCVCVCMCVCECTYLSLSLSLLFPHRLMTTAFLCNDLFCIDTSVFWCAAFEQNRTELGWELDENWYEFSWTYDLSETLAHAQRRSHTAFVTPQQSVNANHTTQILRSTVPIPLTPFRSTLAAAATSTTSARCTSSWKHEYLQV